MSIRFEPELSELRSAGVIDEATATRAIALDRGTVFSLFEELRVALYVAVALIVTGLGIFIKYNLDRIGPITLIVLLALAAAACYASAVRTRSIRARRSLGGDYVLLLGALIVGADLGYAESQFHWFGAEWPRHLLLLAVVHAATAYLLDSRLVLSVALVSLAGWFGIEHQPGNLTYLDAMTAQLGFRALIFSAVILAARVAHRRFKAPQDFASVFEHFAANVAFWGALVWCSSYGMRAWGALVLTGLALAVVLRGMRSTQEMSVVYGVGYAALGYSILARQLIRAQLPATLLTLAILVGAAVLLWSLHARLKEQPD